MIEPVPWLVLVIAIIVWCIFIGILLLLIEIYDRLFQYPKTFMPRPKKKKSSLDE